MHKVAVVAAAIAFGSAAISTDGLARGGGGGGGMGAGHGGDGFGGGHFGRRFADGGAFHRFAGLLLAAWVLPVLTVGELGMQIPAAATTLPPQDPDA
jgi:hypothetical protein